MVVDLQGIIQQSPDDQPSAILTDPAIHCVDETRFDRMNLGKQGMDIFFERHECNKYCTALKLSRFGARPTVAPKLKKCVRFA